MITTITETTRLYVIADLIQNVGEIKANKNH